jgi:hypothetical protein
LEDSSSNIVMLDNLYDYRMGNLNDLSGIDSTSLDTTLSVLIYDYLNLMIHSNYTNLNNSIIDSSSTQLLENAFELYLNNEAHRLVRSWKEFTTNEVIHLKPVRKSYILSDDNTSIIDSYTITILDEIPYDERIYIRYNGEYLEPTSYQTTSDSTSISFEFDSELDFVENDIILIDYYINNYD